MITAQDMALAQAAPVPAQPAAMPARAAALPAQAVTFRERVLLVVLYVTILTSSVAIIEPSPHDGLMGLLAVCCLIAGVKFERKAALLVLLLVVWNVAGLMSLLNVPDDRTTIQYTATSFYLAIAAIVFTCLFAQNTMPRLAVMRSAYILTAVIVAIEAVIGYFHLMPGSDFFLHMDRGAGTFKDPNVFGPFLVWPIMMVMYRVVAQRITLRDLVILGILAIGLFLSFSRGAWMHTGVSVAALLGLMFIAAPDGRARMRLITLTALCAVVVSLVIVALLSIGSVSEMFAQRAQVIQYYDVGEGGRFRLQELALGAVLDFPNGMGPFEFSRIHGVQQHNVYLQAFMVYGWIGGVSYLVLLASTLLFAFRTVLIKTPWQPYLITALAAFIGEVAEGAVIDSDHWRHFYLLLGMLWALAIATTKAVRSDPSLLPAKRTSYVRGI